MLERDTLGIREVRLFNAVVRWSEAECQRQQLQVTPESKRKVLGKALGLIRFPLMTIEEFAAGNRRAWPLLLLWPLTASACCPRCPCPSGCDLGILSETLGSPATQDSALGWDTVDQLPGLQEALGLGSVCYVPAALAWLPDAGTW